jgi:hypothetical protein
MAKTTWCNLKKVLKTHFNIEIHNLNYEDILLGIGRIKHSLMNYKTEAIDTIILLIKRMLILQRENKYVIKEDSIFNLIHAQKHIESLTKNKQTVSKWSQFVEK